MQDKLIINHTFQRFIDEIDLNHIIEDTIIFEFNEYEPIIVSLESNRYKVLLECYSYYDDNKYVICDNNQIEICSGQSFKISDSNNIVDIGYIPSKYMLSVLDISTSKNCTYWFVVNSNKQVSDEGMNNMISRINNFIDGLSIDFFRNVKINNINNKNFNSDYYIYELIKSYHSKILYYTDSILNCLKYNVLSEIKKEKYEKKQNPKTLKMNILNNKDENFYNAKKKLSSKNSDNIILKKYLVKILKILKNNNIDLNKKIFDQNVILHKLKTEKNLIELEIKKGKLSSVDLVDLKNNIKSIDSDINIAHKWIDKLECWRVSYNDSMIRINKILKSEEFLEINIQNSVDYSVTFFENRFYSFFYHLYNELNSKNSSSHKKTERNLFSDKKSYSLFELYGFIVIQNIIKELGFEMCLENDDLFTFHSDSKFVYVKNNYLIRVQYDHYCKKYRNTNDVRVGDIVNKNSYNCKPDYILSFFKDGKLYNSIIIEMKYRRLRYLTDFSGGSTETDATIDDYSQLCGLKNDDMKPVNIISNVLILYPSLKEKIFERNSGLFIGLNVETDFNSSLGYNKIKEIIRKSIFENYEI